MKIDQIKALLNKIDKRQWLLILGITGMILIGLSSCVSTHSEKEDRQETSSDENWQYAATLEEQLETVLSSVEGAGPCQVMVTLEQGTEYIYATEEKNSIDVSETSEDQRFSTGSKTADEATYIMVSTDEGEQPLLLTCLAPKVKGVVVVCNGGNNAAVCRAITKALATALDISENCICVVYGNNS